MKKNFLVVLCFLFLTVSVFAQNTDETEETQLLNEYSRIYGEAIEKGVDGEGSKNIEQVVPGFDAEEILSDMANGETVFSVSDIVEKGIGLLFGEIRNTLKLLVMIIVLGILSTYLTNIQNNLQGQGAVNAAFFVCYLILSGIMAAALLEVVDCGTGLIDKVSVFMRRLVPIILISLTSSGAPVTATTFELVMMGIIEVTQWIVETFFVPMLMMSGALSLANNLSDSMNAEKLVQFLNKTLKWGIGIVMTVFVSIMNLQGLVSGGADILTVRLTKFATSNLIPVVGGALSETVETVINCGTVIRNSVGGLGIIIVVLMAAIPILKIAACLIMFRLSAAVLQPVADKRIVKCLSDMADSVAGMLGMSAVVTVMFVIMLTIVMNVAT